MVSGQSTLRNDMDDSEIWMFDFEVRRLRSAIWSGISIASPSNVLWAQLLWWCCVMGVQLSLLFVLWSLWFWIQPCVTLYLLLHLWSVINYIQSRCRVKYFPIFQVIYTLFVDFFHHECDLLKIPMYKGSIELYFVALKILVFGSLTRAGAMKPLHCCDVRIDHFPISKSLLRSMSIVFLWYSM